MQQMNILRLRQLVNRMETKSTKSRCFLDQVSNSATTHERQLGQNDNYIGLVLTGLGENPPIATSRSQAPLLVDTRPSIEVRKERMRATITHECEQ